MSIAIELVNQVVEIARAHHATRVEEIEVEAGILREIVPEAMEVAFTAAAEGTPAEDARLILSEIKPLAECRACECTFAPDIDCYVCPRCGQADIRIVAGNDLILKSVICHAPDEGISVHED